MSLDDAARVLYERDNGRPGAWDRMTESHKDLYREDFAAALAAYGDPAPEAGDPRMTHAGNGKSPRPTERGL